MALIVSCPVELVVGKRSGLGTSGTIWKRSGEVKNLSVATLISFPPKNLICTWNAKDFGRVIVNAHLFLLPKCFLFYIFMFVYLLLFVCFAKAENSPGSCFKDVSQAVWCLFVLLCVKKLQPWTHITDNVVKGHLCILLFSLS